MSAESVHQQIRSALRSELKKRHGQIGQIEHELQRSEGYLSRFCRGDMEINLKALLETLEILGVDAGDFFRAALGGASTSEALLWRYEATGPLHRSFAAIEDALSRIDERPRKSSSRRQHRACVDSLRSEEVDIQLRRLKSAKKYRSAEFVDEYLVWLDRLRFDDPEGAARLVVGVIGTIVPDLAEDRSTRQRILAHCLLIYASCMRACSEVPASARAIRMGLSLASRKGSEKLRASLLRRGALISTDFAEYQVGLTMLREALEIALDAEDEVELGFISISRGLVYSYAGQKSRAAECLRLGIRRVRASADPEANRFLLAAYSSIAYLHLEDGRLDEARQWLTRGIDDARGAGGLMLAKLLWQQGTLERKEGRLELAVQSLESARESLQAGSTLDYALVSIELAAALLELGIPGRALAIAKSMACLTESMKGNLLAEAALIEFLRIVLAGRLDLGVLDALRKAIESGRPRRSARLGQ